jgi:nitrogen fixation protein NifU and related proteins
MQMDQLYQEIILDHYRRPHGRGLRDPYNGAAHQVNPTCGDEIDMRVQLEDGVLTDVSYDGAGCSISQASASMLFDLVEGRHVADAFARFDAFSEMVGGKGGVEPDEDVLEDGVAFAGVAKYPARVKCALLPWMALKQAVAQATASEAATNAAAGSSAPVNSAPLNSAAVNSASASTGNMGGRDE